MADWSVSVVVPLSSEARHLPGFLESLDAQQGGLAGFELIFVESEDAGRATELVLAWIARATTKATTRVVPALSGGTVAARNAGLDAATGEWVTVWEPQDVLDPGYTAEVTASLATAEARTVHLVSGRLMDVDTETGEVREHPLDSRVGKGDRVVDLERAPRSFPLAAITAFYRRDLLAAGGLRYEELGSPHFTDLHLTCRYLASFERPRIALRRAAHYGGRGADPLAGYRWREPATFTEVPRRGWLGMLEAVAADRGHVPRWAQHVVLTELHTYVTADRTMPFRTRPMAPEVGEQFHAALAEVGRYLDDEVVDAFSAPSRSSLELAHLVLVGMKGKRERPTQALVDHIDTRRRLVRVRYYFGGDLPVEELRINGYLAHPRHAKTRRVDLLGRTMVNVRVLWCSAHDTLSLTLDGAPVLLRVGPANTSYDAGPARMWRRLADQEPPARAGKTRSSGLRRRAGRVVRTVQGLLPEDVATARADAETAATRRLAASRWARRTFADAWLLMDRDTLARDNAEHLYRYLREHQPGVNAHFVLNRDSPDWDRLAAEGFRLLEQGSRRHVAALLNARHLISSQIDNYVVAPLQGTPFEDEGDWSYTFLQHGVTKDDLSAWLRPKPISAMLTVTQDEQDSIVADGTSYHLSSREVVLTGFPRHDRLWELGQSQPERRHVLIAPTWRQDLLGQRVAAGNERELRADFWDSAYARAWRGVLESDRLRAAAEAAGLRILFVPHPNMDGYVAGNPLPGHIEVRRFAEVEIQTVIAEAALLVTDYSSLAFDAAYIHRPVVYHQFDRATFFAGTHVYRQGTWSYPEQGFGPVTEGPEAAVTEVVRLLAAGSVPDEVYAKRMDRTFPFRDGRCCERAYAAIAALDSPAPPESVYSWVEPEVVADVTSASRSPH